FTPPPKVTSSIVQFRPLEAPRFPAELTVLEKVTAAAFGQRRKMLRSSLRGLSENIEDLLRSAEAEPTARADATSLETYCAIARALTTQTI
nr:16S rRNA (adenine(1518)-N(6)/adenine(1519)-N(6))-dimethyltransferase [Paracoccaceae bacterium]